MRRYTVACAAAILFAVAGCSSSPTAAAPEPAPASTAATTEPASTSPTASCSPTRDVIVRYVTPGQPATAQVLGNYNLATCEPTFDWLQQASSTDPGFCTQAAWASDNPGYNPDATPAAPLKHVQVAYGPAC